MHVHRKHLSDLIRVYAKGDDDAAVRREVRDWRAKVQSGLVLTLPGLPPVEIQDEAELNRWLNFRFPRLYPRP